MPQVYFNLPADDLEAVDCLAEREGVSRSEVLREAVAEYLHGRVCEAEGAAPGQAEDVQEALP